MLAQASLRRLYEITGGKAWEPPEPNHPKVVALIDAGYVRRVDGRCGFERFKDSMLAWTDAGRAAIGTRDEQSAGDGK